MNGIEFTRNQPIKEKRLHGIVRYWKQAMSVGLPLLLATGCSGIPVIISPDSSSGREDDVTLADHTSAWSESEKFLSFQRDILSKFSDVPTKQVNFQSWGTPFCSLIQALKGRCIPVDSARSKLHQTGAIEGAIYFNIFTYGRGTQSNPATGREAVAYILDNEGLPFNGLSMNPSMVEEEIVGSLPDRIDQSNKRAGLDVSVRSSSMMPRELKRLLGEGARIYVAQQPIGAWTYKQRTDISPVAIYEISPLAKR